MKRALTIFVLLFLFIGTNVWSILYGRKLEKRDISIQLNTAQAMLWFNNLQKYRRIHADLEAGCPDVAKAKLHKAIDGELRLLQKHVQEHPKTWVDDYMLKRDKEILKTLKTYESPYGGSWTFPKCGE